MEILWFHLCFRGNQCFKTGSKSKQPKADNISLSLSLSHSLVGAMSNEAFYGVSACLGVFHPCLRWAAKLKWRIIQFKTQIASPRMLIPKPNERQWERNLTPARNTVFENASESAARNAMPRCGEAEPTSAGSPISDTHPLDNNMVHVLKTRNFNSTLGFAHLLL